jgi:hypothetical protein
MRDSAVMILLHHAVGEILLLWVAAHVLERQHRDRRLVGQREWDRGQLRWVPGRKAAVANSVSPDRSGDVFDLLFAEVLEGVRQPVAHLIAHNPA